MPQRWEHDPDMRRLFRAAALAVVLVAIAMGAYALYKPLRASYDAKKALQALEAGNLVGARDFALAAQSSAPNSLETARVFAKVWSAIAPGQTVELWQKALEMSGGAAEDRRELVQSLINAGETQQAGKELQGLLKDSPSDPAALYLQVNWLLAAGRSDEALEKAQELVDLAPEQLRYWRLYSLIELSRPASDKSEYFKRLLAMEKDQGPVGLWALEHLCEFCPPDQLEKRIALLLHHPLASRRTLLIAYSLRHRKAGMPYAQIQQDLERLFNKASTADCRELARFYHSIGDDAGVLNLITPAFAVRDKIELDLYLQALEGTRHWDILLHVLQLPGVDVRPCDKQLMLARAFDGLGETAQSEASWRNALSLADSQTLMDVVSTAVVLPGGPGRLDPVMDGLIARLPPFERPLYYRLWSSVALSGRDASGLFKAAQGLSKELPDNLDNKNRFLYYSLLLGQGGDNLKESYSLVKKGPASVAYRVTLSLALLKAGQSGRAYEIINSTQTPDWTVMPVGWQLVRAAILKANGQGVPIVAGANRALKEEQALCPEALAAAAR